MRTPSWARWRPSPGVVGVLVAMIVAFIGIWVAGRDQWVLMHFALIPRRALGPEPWQLLTVALVHFKFAALASSGVGIWFFGTPVEQRGGRGYVFKVLIGATLAGSLAAALLGRFLWPYAAVVGASAAAIGCIAAFGRIYGEQQVLLFGVQAVRAKIIAYIFLVMYAVSYFLDHDWLGLAGGVAAAAWGTWGAGFSLPSVGLWWNKLKLWRMRRRYRVISGGRDTKRWMN
jgi:membrane associated rhomboid family serine protease